jgi:IS6 family transposase
MSRPFLFKWRHSAPEIIVCGLWWALRYASELDQHGRPWLNTTSDSYRIGETYIKIKKQWHYLCRATNAAGATLDCMPRSTPRCRGRGTIFPPSARRTPYDRTAGDHRGEERGIFPAFAALQQERMLIETCLLRQGKYLNNLRAQDHRCLKRRVTPGLGFGSFVTA